MQTDLISTPNNEIFLLCLLHHAQIRFSVSPPPQPMSTSVSSLLVLEIELNADKLIE